MNQDRLNVLLNTPRMFWVELKNENTTAGLFDFIQKYLNENSVGVEVGSFQGVSSEMFALCVGHLTCVDPFAIGDPEIDKHLSDAEIVFDEMSKDYNNITKLKLTSIEAAKLFPDNSLDFVYIDGMHDYQNCRADIEVWYPKIKEGGIVAGHDHNYPDVASAVRDTIKSVEIFSDYTWAHVK